MALTIEFSRRAFIEKVLPINWIIRNKYLSLQKNMNYDISESVSQRGSGEETAENSRIHEVANELRRRCQLYEAQFRDGKSNVNHLDVEQRVTELYFIVTENKNLSQEGIAFKGQTVV